MASRKVDQLRAIVGAASDIELSDLLSRCGNSVQDAANAFFDRPPAGGNRGGGAALKRGHRNGGDTATKTAHGGKKSRKMEAPSTVDIEDLDRVFGGAKTAEIHGCLLSWYDDKHRVLPWRRNGHSLHELSAESDAKLAIADSDWAYRVWVSEIMLQQTRVATVIEYFERWVARWPTISALAAATIDEVNAVWAGLGYYRRAKFLLEGAKKVMGSLGGVMPRCAKSLEADLPGVGPYTAGEQPWVAE
jgi:hypothetical protein